MHFRPKLFKEEAQAASSLFAVARLPACAVAGAFDPALLDPLLFARSKGDPYFF